MKAAPNVSQPTYSPQLRNGVLTLFGYGINVRVDRGHLFDRRRRRCLSVTVIASLVSGTGSAVWSSLAMTGRFRSRL